MPPWACSHYFLGKREGGDNERMYPIEFEIKGQDKKIVYYHFDILI